jgi:hypothetical protein
MTSLTNKSNESTGSSDIRIKYLEWYRAGQERILNEVVDSLVQVLSEFDDDNDDDGDDHDGEATTYTGDDV